ncbi:hypothetical protein ACFSL6_16005 [Paenibacillus thailandensis]|uniref:ABC-2 transporter permease n=1 Tax=Paenibacillus thailandensis TaxID=393250 RepID=A0ABW5QVK9_9BACL
MNKWQGAWHIARHELARGKIGSIITVLFSAYLVFTTFPLYDIPAEQPELSRNVLDFILLAVFPVLGFSFNRSTFRYWREDICTHSLAQWRTMPIPVESIALGRLLMLAIHLVPAAVLYFTALYFAVPGLKEAYDVGPYILGALFWLFYSLGVASVYLYYELTLSGKRYTVVCFVVLFLFVAVAIGAGMAELALVVGVFDAIQQGSWWYTALALLFGAASLVGIGYNRLCAKLKARTF